MCERFERAQRYSAISRRMTSALNLLGDDAAEKITPREKKLDGKSNVKTIVLNIGEALALHMYKIALEEYTK